MHPLDIQNAISLLSDNGYEVKRKPTEIQLRETRLNHCGDNSLYHISFQCRSLGVDKEQKIIKAISAIVENDRPFSFTPTCEY